MKRTSSLLPYIAGYLWPLPLLELLLTALAGPTWAQAQATEWALQQIQADDATADHPEVTYAEGRNPLPVPPGFRDE